MTHAGGPLSAELSVLGVGRRDGVGVCASTGKILSTGGMAPAVGVGGVIKAVLCSTGGVVPVEEVGKMGEVGTKKWWCFELLI